MYAKKIVLHFPSQLVDKPIIYKLVKDFDLEFNILKASVTPQEEGLMVLELRGEEKKYKEALKYLQKVGVSIQKLSQDVTRDEQSCIHCGVCVPICPTAAFEVEPKTGKIKFLQDKCIACEFCVKVCPYKAMTVKM